MAWIQEYLVTFIINENGVEYFPKAYLPLA